MLDPESCRSEAFLKSCFTVPCKVQCGQKTEAALLFRLNSLKNRLKMGHQTLITKGFASPLLSIEFCSTVQRGNRVDFVHDLSLAQA